MMEMMMIMINVCNPTHTHLCYMKSNYCFPKSVYVLEFNFPTSVYGTVYKLRNALYLLVSINKPHVQRTVNGLYDTYVLVTGLCLMLLNVVAFYV